MEHLAQLKKDKTLAKIIAPQKPIVLTQRKYIHLQLCNAVMSQQLNTKVAAVFHARFLSLYNNKIPSCKQIDATNIETLLNIGLSNAKANYIKNIAQFFLVNKITDAKLYKLTNDEIINLLTQIKGIGNWTVEMILMFALQREDVFAIDDLVIQQSMSKLYKIDTSNKKELKIKLIKISDKWKPYRTYACKYLWGWVNSQIQNAKSV
jgi:DNA-3-methyladenine glycosylase II